MRFYLSVLLIVAMAAAVYGFAVPTLISARFSIAVLLGFALGALFPVVVAFLTYRLLYLPITRKCKR
ncbi:Uncharacterised protein [Serratia quinivorans]|uniref:hypothetical protein n=1 Tax=Serratia quinivorans TaxID=137545 RepID=UPI00217BAE4D|nr:hypothetical protein [Serratia quinivorans]CAI0908016.1 Uncharacterised protein [Serratia quinivorans]CAI0925772.1 Uncharacterised protein [Serratia quinivorans]CAI1715039.1 Uncharacterised protein [Serratia quinivorans]CAI2089766.1 Uncharacterised protein [Serratia quinivorans]CAI2455038.1 Uncharacterised protein [Serratia quinivorans]